jgi:hypothetical protein
MISSIVGRRKAWNALSSITSITSRTFSQAQQDRNEADYNLLREWQPTQVRSC